jgi:formylglycine-generating enzyme required for sulfatase activity
MGSKSTEEGRFGSENIHKVTLTLPFWLGRTEVTQQEYKSVIGKNPSRFHSCGGDCPVEKVSWLDAVNFCNRASTIEGLKPAYVYVDGRLRWDRSANGYRLPTEAEWEYTCRAGTNTLWSFGDDERQKEEYTWYEANAWGTNVRYAHQVGTKRPNPWSLHDMHGNVWEWCQDWHGPYTSEDRVDPMGPPHGKARIGRGGAFSDYIETSRSAFRNRSEPEIRYGIIGARLVRRK